MTTNAVPTTKGRQTLPAISARAALNRTTG
jgi:hypothetical protein